MSVVVMSPHFDFWADDRTVLSVECADSYGLATIHDPYLDTLQDSRFTQLGATLGIDYTGGWHIRVSGGLSNDLCYEIPSAPGYEIGCPDFYDPD